MELSKVLASVRSLRPAPPLQAGSKGVEVGLMARLEKVAVALLKLSFKHPTGHGQRFYSLSDSLRSVVGLGWY